MSNHNDSQDNQKGNANLDGSAILEFPETKTVDTQASEWLAKLDAETPSKEDLQAFKVWVNEADEHRIAFEEMVSFWDEMNILTQAVLPRESARGQLQSARGEMINSARGVIEKPNSELQQESGSVFEPMTRLFRSRPQSLTAAFATVAVAVTLLTTTNLWQATPTLYTTQVGEQKTFQLADNSTVQLNTNSRLEVDYSDNYRRLKLVQGEAHFDVAHNPDRPFEVFAGQGLVRAIGTAFTVHVRKIDVEVIVTQGTIELDRADLAAPVSTPSKTDEDHPQTQINVTAGNMLTFSRDELDDIKLLVANQIEDQLAWRRGMLVFQAEPLQNVVNEVSRYTNLKIVIPERSTREMKVGGLFKVGDTESLFEALRDGFDIHAKEISDDVYYLISSENR